MQYDYIVTLKRDHEKQVDSTSVFLCTFSIVAFAFAQVRRQQVSWLLCLGAVLLVSGLIVNLMASRKTGKIIRYKYWLVIAAIGWLAMPALQWLCAVFFLLAFLEYQAKYPLEIGFTRQAIVVNSLFRKKFAWSDFSHIMLKEGLLTMDFKNNRLIQKETVDDDDQYDADEDEFNEYCRQQLGQ